MTTKKVIKKPAAKKPIAKKRTGLKSPATINQADARVIKYLTESTSGLKLSIKNARTTEQKRNLKEILDNSETTLKNLKAKHGLSRPAAKGLTTFCARTIGVTGRRKKDGTQKKGYVAKAGGKMVKTTRKKPVATKKK